MPLFYVNDDLVQEELRGENTWEKDGNRDQYKRIMLKTAGGAVKRSEDGTSFSSIERIICTHNCSTNPAARTRIVSTIMDGDKFPKVTVRTSMDTKYDTDVFVVALPYEGLIMPIDIGDDLAIYRFMILKSDRVSIEHEGKTYRRCLYLIAAPKYTEKGGDGWYSHSCDLKIKTIQSNKPRNAEAHENDGTWKWTVTETTVRFAEYGNHEISVETSEVPYDNIDPDAFRNARLCKVVEPTKIEGRPQPRTQIKDAFDRAGNERDVRNSKRGKKNRKR